MFSVSLGFEELEEDEHGDISNNGALRDALPPELVAIQRHNFAVVSSLPVARMGAVG